MSLQPLPHVASAMGLASTVVERKLIMPNASMGTNPISEVSHNGVVVIVGSNGSGKTRLGAWLESPQNISTSNMSQSGPKIGCHRISAQRILSFPQSAKRQSESEAHSQFSSGTSVAPYRTTRLYGDPIVGQMEDYSLLINYLFAESAEINRQYSDEGRVAGKMDKPPKESVLIRAKRIWESVFTERELVIKDHVIMAQARGNGSIYLATNMSDGERVGFYLIGQVLLLRHEISSKLNSSGILNFGM